VLSFKAASDYGAEHSFGLLDLLRSSNLLVISTNNAHDLSFGASLRWNAFFEEY
jgi:hypothetical protein